MKKYLAIIISFAALSACSKKIFDKHDLTGLPPDDVWNTESTATLFINKTYDLVMPAWPTGIHNTSDESNNLGSSAIFYGQLTSDGVPDIYAAPGNGNYFFIRRCNIALEGIAGGNLAPDIKMKLRAQNFYLRAYVYFNMVKLYGGVPIVNHVQDVVEEDLLIPRSKTSVCIDSIARDLDSAAAGLPGYWPASDRGRIVRGAALALKGKVLLFWASAQFNPGNDAARWERAYQANKAAYDTLTKDGYGLNPTFANIFMDENTVISSGSATNKEPIVMRLFDQINKTTTIENTTRPASETTGGGGSNQPTMNLVNAFPMKSGIPITTAGSGYDAVYFWKNRDPRFDATVAYNGVVWPLSQKAGRIQWVYTGLPEDGSKVSVTGFYNRKMCNVNVLAANTVIGNGTDWIEMRFAEVLLNLAECASQSGRMSEAYNLLILLRKRAGIPDPYIDPVSSASVPNPLLGLKAGMTPAEMLTTIITERQIEFAFEGKRYDDLRRTRMFTALNGTVRTGIKITVKAPYKTAADTSSAANKTGNLEYYYAPGKRMRDTINVNTSDYTKYFTISTVNLDASSPINFLSNYYFYPMPLSALQSNTAIQQTLGWPGGTFDPLQ